MQNLNLTLNTSLNELNPNLKKPDTAPSNQQKLIARVDSDRIMLTSYDFVPGQAGYFPRLFDNNFTASGYAENSFQAKFITRSTRSLDEIVYVIRNDQKERNSGKPSSAIVLATHGGANAIGTADGKVYAATDVVDRLKKEGLIAPSGWVVFDGCAVAETSQAQQQLKAAAVRNNVTILAYTGEVFFAQKKPNTGIIFWPNGTVTKGVSI